MRSARRSGIAIHARAVGAGTTVELAGDERLEDVAAVIWATGFDRDYSPIDAPVAP